MKRNLFCCFIIGVVVCIGFFGCGKKKKSVDQIVIINSDTMLVAELSRISPDTVVTQQKIKQLAIRFSLAQSFEAQNDTGELSDVVNDFADQLSRESNVTWSKEQAAKLYGAVKLLQEKSSAHSTFSEISACLDSCQSEIILPADSAGAVKVVLDSSTVFIDTSVVARKKQLAALCVSILGVEQSLSEGIAEFIYSEEYLLKDQGAMSDMIKGLVYDSTKKSKKVIAQAEKSQPDNSKLALKYRDQKSIQETIAQHTPILEGIYKKELKKDPTMEGVVYITFRVGPAGNVLSATVKTSSIANRDFINPLLDYVTKIKFKPIPEKIGNMTFDFPFDFKPEM